MDVHIQPITLSEDRTRSLYANDLCKDIFDAFEEYYPVIGFHSPWIGYFIVRENTVVGSCGYKGQPQNGKVEIAYTTFPDYEKQGLATEACRQLVELALKTDSSLTVIAYTLRENNASTRILKRNGFEYTGDAIDEKDGMEVWEWTYRK